MLGKLKNFFSLDNLNQNGGYLEILRIAYPLIIMSASHTIMQFCDRKFLGLNSTADVAAALPAGVLSFTLFSFFMVNVNFTSALVAQHYGNKDQASCVRAAWNGFYFALASSVIILFVVPWIGMGIIVNSGHDPEIVSRELVYYKTLIPSGVFVCLSGAFCSYFSGMGKTWYVTVINIASCIINVFLDYAMIFGKWGFPAWGIAGAGIATSISTLISFAIAFSCFIFQNQRERPTRKHRQFCFADIKRLISFGTPAGVQCFLEVGGFTACTFLIGRISPDAMAITTIAMSINMISFLPLLGLSDGTAILVGQYIGAQRHDVAEKVPYRSWHMAVVYMIFAGAVFLIFPSWLIGQFTPGSMPSEQFAALVATGAGILACAAVFNFFDATKFVFMGGLRGAGDTKVLMIICVSAVWTLMVPGVWLLIVIVKAAIVSVWVYMAIYLGVEAMIVFARFRCGSWKRIEMIRPEAGTVPLESSLEPGRSVPVE